MGVLLKFLGHNTVVVQQAIIELGIEAEFWSGATKPDTSAVLEFPGVG